MSRRLLAAVAVAALTLGLASCGDGGKGTVTTPPPTIGIGQSDDGGAGPSDDGGAEPSNSDGAGEGEDSPAAAPDIPAPDPADYPGMDQETPEGAEQAFKFFWALILWAHQTGDSSVLEGLYADECNSCASMADDVEQIAKDGTFWTSVEVEEVSVEVDGSWEEYDSVVTYSFILGEHLEPTPGDSQPESVPDQGVTSVGALEWSGESWVLVDLGSQTAELDG